MATEKKEINVLDLFVKHAASETEAKRVYKLVGDDFMKLSFDKLLKIKGMGRKGLLLVAEVAADLAGKK